MSSKIHALVDTDALPTVLDHNSNLCVDGRSIAIHCRAGIGRSSLVAASVLICLGTRPGEALRLIGNARGVPVPATDDQRDWVMAFGRAHEA